MASGVSHVLEGGDGGTAVGDLADVVVVAVSAADVDVRLVAAGAVNAEVSREVDYSGLNPCALFT